jgi:hypothetical protein
VCPSGLLLLLVLLVLSCMRLLCLGFCLCLLGALEEFEYLVAVLRIGRVVGGRVAQHGLLSHCHVAGAV